MMSLRGAKVAAVSLTLMISAAVFAKTVDQGVPDHAIADAKAAMLVDPASALSKAAAAKMQAKRMSPGTPQAIVIATADWLQAEALVRLDKPSLAMPIAAEALRLERQIAPHTKLQADTLLARGGGYADLNQSGSALADYQAAFGIYRMVGDQRGQTIALLNIADLYRVAKDYDNAIKYLTQAKETVSSDAQLMYAAHLNLAIILQRMNNCKNAEKELNIALLIARKINIPDSIALAWRNIAQCQLARKDVAGAERSVANARAASKRGGLQDDPVILSTMAQVALMRRDGEDAKRLIDRAFAGIDPSQTALPLREAHQTAYEVYRAVGNPDLALVHLAALKRLDDQATKLATTASTALMAARFDFAKVKADELQRKISFERQQAKTERSAFIVTSIAEVAVMLLMVFALLISRRSRRRVNAANRDLADTNTALGKALAAKTEFLATTSHEIRTPLNGILGMTQVMLADAGITDDMRDRLGIVHGAGITMRALVDDILDVAKMETGNLTIEHAPFDLAATIRDATRLWDDQARTKDITFAWRLDRCPQMIEGDAARVRQIIFNLLSNAIKFTPAGRVELRVEAVAEDRYRIAVTDTGIGIPADKTTEIFESFRQADAGTTRQFGGTGLGLAICRNLAQAMGGDIAVDSVVGEGSTFTVTLPLVHAAPPATCDTVGEGGTGILIVDRNPITRAMLRTLLAPKAGMVALAGSATEAIACLSSIQVAQILIDDATIRVGTDPLADLALLAGAAREKNAVTALLWPVVAAAEHQELLSTGIDRVIAKPVSGAALVEHLFGLSKQPNDYLVSRAA